MNNPSGPTTKWRLPKILRDIGSRTARLLANKKWRSKKVLGGIGVVTASSLLAYCFWPKPSPEQIAAETQRTANAADTMLALPYAAIKARQDGTSNGTKEIAFLGASSPPPHQDYPLPSTVAVLKDEQLYVQVTRGKKLTWEIYDSFYHCQQAVNVRAISLNEAIYDCKSTGGFLGVDKAYYVQIFSPPDAKQYTADDVTQALEAEKRAALLQGKGHKKPAHPRSHALAGGPTG